MASLSLRIDLDPGGRIGPGKVELLEHIAAFGSISEGARRMNMSYKQAWLLVEEMNRLFGKPVVSAARGGRRGGGTQLTSDRPRCRRALPGDRARRRRRGGRAHRGAAGGNRRRRAVKPLASREAGLADGRP